MAFCLIKSKADEFLRKIKSGELDINKLSEMTSAERVAKFMKSLGLDKETAKQVNALFESKLLLKYQKRGMINWIEKTAGLKQDVKRDLISRINRLDKVLDPKEEAEFLSDLAAKKLGMDVTKEEAKGIFRLAKKAEDLRTQPDKGIEYGNALIDFNEYIAKLNKEPFELRKLGVNIGNLFKTLMSSWDLSMYFRQGWGVMSTKEFWKNFPKGVQFFVSEKAHRNALAKMIGDKSFEIAQRAKLGITKLSGKLTEREEAFQSSLLDKLPIFRGSMRAFTGFLNIVRYERFNCLIEKAKLAGEDIRLGSQATKDIAAVVNNFTGRGSLGRIEHVTPELNLAFFSPRKISATVNMMNPKNFLNPKLSKTARKAHLRQLIGSLAMTVGMLALAKSMGHNVETDPISSDTGKIKVDKTRIDMTGGNSTYAVLLARLISGKTKSSTTGKKYELGTGYKPTTRLTLIGRFSRNKLSPGASLVADIIAGQDFKGEKLDIKKELLERMRPLIISSILEMADSKAPADLMFMMILAELLGFGVQTY